MSEARYCFFTYLSYFPARLPVCVLWRLDPPLHHPDAPLLRRQQQLPHHPHGRQAGQTPQPPIHQGPPSVDWRGEQQETRSKLRQHHPGGPAATLPTAPPPPTAAATATAGSRLRQDFAREAKSLKVKHRLGFLVQYKFELVLTYFLLFFVSDLWADNSWTLTSPPSQRPPLPHLLPPANTSRPLPWPTATPVTTAAPINPQCSTTPPAASTTPRRDTAWAVPTSARPGSCRWTTPSCCGSSRPTCPCSSPSG